MKRILSRELGLLHWLEYRIYHITVSVCPSVLVCVSTKEGKNTKKQSTQLGGRERERYKNNTLFVWGQPQREVFGLPSGGRGVSSTADWMPRWLDVFAVIYRMNRNDNDNIDHEQRELYIELWYWVEFRGVSVLYTRSWSARREWVWGGRGGMGRERALLYTP